MDGRNIVAGRYVSSESRVFHAINAATGESLPGDFYPATEQDADDALKAAQGAFKEYRLLGNERRAAFLRAIAAEISALGAVLTERAVAESGLPEARISGETGRTTGQLNLFASLVEEGSWVDAVIDTAQPDRKPLARPDIRKMLNPVGPVVVFGASNFPLAFSVAGGDTASALAAGCPVIVKVHPAHPGTSALIGAAILKAVAATGMPEGVFSMLYDSGYSVGEVLVGHPLTKAVTFTGSYKGGMALAKLAAERSAPIPVFAEMGSINPVVLLPGSLQKRPHELASKYAASITLGGGQFCTNPGLLLGIKSEGLDSFISELSKLMSEIPSATMLTPGICKNYHTLSEEVLQEKGVSLFARSEKSGTAEFSQSAAILAGVTATEFISNPRLREEIFGPYSLLVLAEDEAELEQVVASLEGQLTVTIMGEEEELETYTDVIDSLSQITGRIILNGVPTGVEVCHAMQHGGPFPATNDSRFTSVGSDAVYRFVRPLAWQDWKNELLPPELQDGNPLAIWRKVNNNWTKD